MTGLRTKGTVSGVLVGLGLLAATLGAAAQDEIAATGNGGTADGSANGGAVATDDITSGSNAGNAIGIGDTAGGVAVDGGAAANATSLDVAAEGGRDRRQQWRRCERCGPDRRHCRAPTEAGTRTGAGAISRDDHLGHLPGRERHADVDQRIELLQPSGRRGVHGCNRRLVLGGDSPGPLAELARNAVVRAALAGNDLPAPTAAAVAGFERRSRGARSGSSSPSAR